MRRSTSKALVRVLSIASLAHVAAIGHAQTAPDAGALRQQIERDRLPALPPDARPAKPLTPAPLKNSDAANIPIKAFRFVGNTVLSEQQLAPAIASFTGRTLDFTELQQAAEAVAVAYRHAGWVARAYLPQQDVTEGTITIQIVEAVFAGAVLQGPAPTRLKFDRVLRFFDTQQKKGDLLNAQALDRALLLVDDLPGVSVAGVLQEGQTERQTELILKLNDEPLLIGEAGIDNAGSRATGEVRASVSANLNSPLGLGDLFTSHLIHTSGNDYLRVGYTLPASGDGLRLGASLSALHYRLTTPEFAALNFNGSSQTYGLDAGYPLIRSRQRNVYLLLNLDQKRFRNEFSAALQSKYHSNSYSLGASGNIFDNLGGGGANSASLTYMDGTINQGNPNPGENPLVNGGFSKWRLSLARQQAVSDKISLFGSFVGQQAAKNLDSSEKFFLGGGAGVRAYPSNEGAGSSGRLATLEVRGRATDNVNLTGFYDWGHVANYDSTPSYNLKGYGVAVGWSAFGLNLKATLARRRGENPNPTATGNDQDGSSPNRTRFWLTVNFPFAGGRLTTGSGALTPAPTSAPAPTQASAQIQTPAIPLPAPAPTSTPMTSVPAATLAAPASDGVMDFVDTWKKAWVSGNASAYLGTYADDFKPRTQDMSRASWLVQRKARVTPSLAIQIELSNVTVAGEGSERLVAFDQRYRSTRYADKVRKVLRLVQRNSQWFIAEEQSMSVTRNLEQKGTTP